MSNTISPNMGLIVPGVGQEPGPTWATDLNADLGILDQHDHSSGSGVPVNTNGININADLPMHDNNLTQVNTVNFQAHLSALPGLFPNLGAIYVAGNELYYNDEIGNVVQITNTGSVNAGAGSITGLPSGTASVTYNSGSQTYVFQSATSTTANIDGGSFIFRDITANSKGVTVSAPPALAADYQIFLPSTLPGTTSFLTLDNSGGIGDSVPLLGALTTSNLSSSAGILGTQIANNTITPNNMGAANYVISSGNSGSFTITTGSGITDVTNLTLTITTFGRPVVIGLIGNSTGSYSYSVSSNTSQVTSNLILQRGGVDQVINQCIFSNGAAGDQVGYFFPGVLYFDPVAAGTYVYKLQAQTVNATMLVVNLSLYAYEI